MFSIPEDAEAYTAMAIGYQETSAEADPALRERDAKPRARRPLDEFVFSERFGEPSVF